MKLLSTSAYFCSPGQLDQTQCRIVKVVRLDEDAFDHFVNYPEEDYDFITENLDLMRFETYAHDEFELTRYADCILVTGESRDDGVAVYQESEYISSRSVALLPNVSYYINQHYQKMAASLFEYLESVKEEFGPYYVHLSPETIQKETGIDIQYDPAILDMLHDQGKDIHVHINNGVLCYGDNLRYIVAEPGQEARIENDINPGILRFAEKAVNAGFSDLASIPVRLGNSSAIVYYNKEINAETLNRKFAEGALKGTIVITGMDEANGYKSLTDEQAQELVTILDSPECFVSKLDAQNHASSSNMTYKSLERLQEKLKEKLLNGVYYVLNEYDQMADKNNFSLDLEDIYLSTNIKIENNMLGDTLLEMLKEWPEFENINFQVEGEQLVAFPEQEITNTQMMQ